MIRIERRPVAAASLELHAASGAMSEKSDEKIIASAQADERGAFDLGIQRPGNYVILMTKPFYEKIPVQLRVPMTESSGEDLDIHFSADTCLYIDARPHGFSYVR